jgi:hypothetical protein
VAPAAADEASNAIRRTGAVFEVDGRADVSRPEVRDKEISTTVR